MKIIRIKKSKAYEENSSYYNSYKVELVFSTSHYDVGWLFEFYGISTFVGYLMPNQFLYK